MHQPNYNMYSMGAQQYMPEPMGYGAQGQALDPRYSDEASRKKYGLARIDECLKNKNGDNSMFTFGVDLTNFGLNISIESPELFMTFGSPFSENPTRKLDAQNFPIQQCYNKHQLVFKKENLKKFPLQTLFYIFYNVIDENSQLWATEELYEKGWKYHKAAETWFNEIVPKAGTKNQYSCQYFNINKWALTTIDQIEFNLENDFCTIEGFRSSVN